MLGLRFGGCIIPMVGLHLRCRAGDFTVQGSQGFECRSLSLSDVPGLGPKP